MQIDTKQTTNCTPSGLNYFIFSVTNKIFNNPSVKIACKTYKNLDINFVKVYVVCTCSFSLPVQATCF